MALSEGSTSGLGSDASLSPSESQVLYLESLQEMVQVKQDFGHYSQVLKQARQNYQAICNAYTEETSNDVSDLQLYPEANPHTCGSTGSLQTPSKHQSFQMDEFSTTLNDLEWPTCTEGEWSSSPSSFGALDRADSCTFIGSSSQSCTIPLVPYQSAASEASSSNRFEGLFINHLRQHSHTPDLAQVQKYTRTSEDRKPVATAFRSEKSAALNESFYLQDRSLDEDDLVMLSNNLIAQSTPNNNLPSGTQAVPNMQWNARLRLLYGSKQRNTPKHLQVSTSSEENTPTPNTFVNRQLAALRAHSQSCHDSKQSTLVESPATDSKWRRATQANKSSARTTHRGDTFTVRSRTRVLDKTNNMSNSQQHTYSTHSLPQSTSVEAFVTPCRYRLPSGRYQSRRSLPSDVSIFGKSDTSSHISYQGCIIDVDATTLQHITRPFENISILEISSESDDSVLPLSPSDFILVDSCSSPESVENNYVMTPAQKLDYCHSTSKSSYKESDASSLSYRTVSNRNRSCRPEIGERPPCIGKCATPVDSLYQVPDSICPGFAPGDVEEGVYEEIQISSPPKKNFHNNRGRKLNIFKRFKTFLQNRKQ